MCKNQKQQSNVAIFIDRQKYKWYIDNRKSAFSRLTKECSAQFLAQEEGGTKTDITALFVHSQDHLMTSITEINLIKEMIDLRKELSAKQ